MEASFRKEIMTNPVLIVEDDPETVELVGLYLRRDGHEVVTAGDGVDTSTLAPAPTPSD